MSSHMELLAGNWKPNHLFKHLKGLLTTGFDLSGCGHKSRVNMRNKFFVYTLMFLNCHVLCNFVNFSLQPKMLNFKFIKVTCKLRYLRWLNFVQEKWWRGRTWCLHEKWLFCFRMSWHSYIKPYTRLYIQTSS